MRQIITRSVLSRSNPWDVYRHRAKPVPLRGTGATQLSAVLVPLTPAGSCVVWLLPSARPTATTFRPRW